MNSDRVPLPNWIPLFWVTALLLALLALPTRAEAGSLVNPDPAKRLHSMHYANVSEQFCIESHDTSRIGNSAARSFVSTVLTGGSDSQNWDNTGGGRINLVATQKNCTAYDSDTRETIEIEVHYAEDWSGACGGDYGYWNCTNHAESVYNADFGYWDSRWAYVDLVFSSGGQLNDTGKAFINHEFGHVFGLQHDAACTRPSIMYSQVVGYGCTNWQNRYPSSADFDAAVRVMNGALS